MECTIWVPRTPQRTRGKEADPGGCVVLTQLLCNYSVICIMCETSPTLGQPMLVVWATGVVWPGRRIGSPSGTRGRGRANGRSASHVISQAAGRPALMQRRGSSHDEGSRATGLRRGVACVLKGDTPR